MSYAKVYGLELVFRCGAGSVYYNPFKGVKYRYVVPGVGACLSYAAAVSKL